MFPTRTHNLLSVLLEQNPDAWMGKSFLTACVTGDASELPQISVNYPDEFSLGVGTGLLIGRGYAVHRTKGPDVQYLFTVDKRVLSLRVHKKVRVVDFDDVTYDPKTEFLAYKDTLRYPTSSRQAFKKKICKLLFCPYEEQNEEVWKTRQKALLSYIKKGWTIIDMEGKEVNFIGTEDSRGYINPEVLWVARSCPPQPEHAAACVEKELTRENFLKEFTELLAKYNVTLSEGASPK